METQVYSESMCSIHLRRIVRFLFPVLIATQSHAFGQTIMSSVEDATATFSLAQPHPYLPGDPNMDYAQLPGQHSPGVSSVAAGPTSELWSTWEAHEKQRTGGYYYFEADPRMPPDPTAVSDDPWFWQVLPEGIIYHSYWAGVHEPRFGVQLISDRGGDSYWDPTIGARVGIFRYGNDNPLHPQGLQLDVEGAAMARLMLDDMSDLQAVDFRGGVPLTYGIDNWQFKVGYYHLSAHLGDEYAINHPGSLDQRINYVRDSFMLGVSCYPIDVMRLYAEADYAFYTSGGAEPWEFQFGTELSRPGLTGPGGSPFLAINIHLREEHDFGGDITAEAGWLWRGRTGQVMRIGAFYFNGKSSQYQFYNDSQQQLVAGIWYDF